MEKENRAEYIRERTERENPKSEGHKYLHTNEYEPTTPRHNIIVLPFSIFISTFALSMEPNRALFTARAKGSRESD